ncbi:MAG TPA: hypothetical protein VK880_13095 [Anaerolineales bacterium]|nr:hypothetical protein [Anaerolineales bacterium]
MQKLLFIFTLVSLLAGCAPNTEVQPASNVQPTSTKSLEDYRLKVGAPTLDALTATAQTAIALSTPPADCPVTTAGNASFQAPAPHAPVAPWEGLFWYGADGLWTALHTDGVWAELPKTSDGYTQKIVWWSDSFVLKDELEPALVVTGQRLDAKSEPLRFYGATHMIEEEAGEAMLTGVEFPTFGCWEVRAEYKKSELKFVVWIAP